MLEKFVIGLKKALMMTKILMSKMHERKRKLFYKNELKLKNNILIYNEHLNISSVSLKAYI